MPGRTTISSSEPAIPGDTQIAVASTLGFDNKEEQAVIVGSGGNREIIPLLPGPTSIATYQNILEYAYPFPGYLQLATPLTYAHLANDPVIGCYQEVREVGSTDSIDRFGQVITQEAQIATQHMSTLVPGNTSRVAFVANYPLIEILDIQASYSFAHTFFNVDHRAMNIIAREGYFTLPIGVPVYEQSILKTTYIGGYATIPEDVKYATLFFLADELTFMSSSTAQGIRRTTMGKRTIEYSGLNAQGQSPYTLRAEGVLCEGGYKKQI